MPDDASLLREFAESRSQAAFAEVVRRHVDAVYSTAVRRVGGDTHLAEDVTQQVFVALARHARSVAPHPVLTGWLYITTRNEAANVVRAERRRRAREQEAFHMDEMQSASAGEPDWSRLAPVIDQEVDRLSERDRAAVLLRFFEHHAFADIGRQLGVSEDAARMRVERALEKLRGGLRRRGLHSSSAALAATLTSHAVSAAPANLAAAATTGALTSFTASGATTLAVAVHLMLTSKSVFVVAGIVLLLAGGGAGYELRSSTAAESTRAEAARVRAAVSSQLASERTRLARLQSDAGTQKTSRSSDLQNATGAGVNASSSVPPTATQPTADPTIARGNEFMRRHPEVREALIEFFDASTNTRFGPLYRELHMTPTEIDRFREFHRDYSGYGQALDPNGEMVQFRHSKGRSPEQIGEELKELLGADRYKRMTQYAAESGPREIAESVASGLALFDPLTSGQAQQLVSFIAAAKSKGPTGGQQFDWNLITAQARNLLNPAQLEVLAGIRRQHDFSAALDATAAAGGDRQMPSQP